MTDFLVPGKIIIQNRSLMFAARNWLKFLSDLKEWVNHLILMNYGDDTSLSHRGYNMNTMLENLEEDVTNILQFMAFNGLVANPNKFMLLNNQEKSNQEDVGQKAEIQETEGAKHLRIAMDNDQKWTSHFWEKKGKCFATNKEQCNKTYIRVHVGQSRPLFR